MFFSELILHGFALVGIAASIVMGVKIITNKTFDESVNTVSNWIKNNITPYEMFCLENISGFLSGLRKIVEKNSSLPFELTSTLQGTTGTFDFYKIQIIADDTQLMIFEKSLNNLVYKTLVFAGVKTFDIKILSDNLGNDIVVTVYYATTAKRIQALQKWYLQQIDLEKNNYISSPLIDNDLEKDMNDLERDKNDC